MAGLLKCLLMLQHETLVPNQTVDDAAGRQLLGLNAAPSSGTSTAWTW